LIAWVGALGIAAAAANLTLAASPATPSERQAMQALFGAGYAGRGVVLSVPGAQRRVIERVQPWLTASLTLDGVPYFIATAQGQEVTDPKAPSFASHAQSAYISAIWYALRNGRWTWVGKSYNLAEDGAFGKVNGDPWTPFPQVAMLRGGALLVASENDDMHQGYGTSWLPIYWFSKSGLQSLGNVISGGDNTGADTQPGIAFTGKAVTAGVNAEGMPLITVSYSGHTAIGDKPLMLNNTPCTFIYRRNPKQPGHSAFTATTPQCQSIVDSAIF
jgi:hypothetical protein